VKILKGGDWRIQGNQYHNIIILFYYYFQCRVADLPPLQFHHPPSPGAPLNCIQRVRSRSREDIEGGGLGDSR